MNSNEPRIYKEGFDSDKSYRITDEMFKNRHILCSGTIEPDLVNSLISQILYLSKEDSNEEIVIYINSHGGSVGDGLALYDVMQAVSCPIRTVCIGMAASMGALLFAAGDERQMLPHSRVMIHDPLLSQVGGSALHLQSISKDLMHTRQITAEILSKHTGRTLEEIYDKTQTDSYFYANEAIEFGLADTVITKL